MERNVWLWVGIGCGVAFLGCCCCLSAAATLLTYIQWG